MDLERLGVKLLSVWLLASRETTNFGLPSRTDELTCHSRFTLLHSEESSETVKPRHPALPLAPDIYQ
jgi:hypothetical protein